MKYKVPLLLIIALVTKLTLQAQSNTGSSSLAKVSNTSPATSTTKAFLPPVITSTRINAIALPNSSVLMDRMLVSNVFYKLDIDSTALILLITKAMQEQQAQSATQTAEIADLKKTNVAMTAQNADILAQNTIINAQLIQMKKLKKNIAAMRSKLNKTTVSQVAILVPVILNN